MPRWCQQLLRSTIQDLHVSEENVRHGERAVGAVHLVLEPGHLAAAQHQLGHLQGGEGAQQQHRHQTRTLRKIQ